MFQIIAPKIASKFFIATNQSANEFAALKNMLWADAHASD